MSQIPANLISSQRFLDENTVEQKQADEDYTVQYALVEVEGQEYMVVVDGHHSLEASKRDGAEPDLEECELETFSFAERNPDDFLIQHHHGDDYYYCANGKLVWQ
jgi:uncharacterized ParB-like nuclease family protein